MLQFKFTTHSADVYMGSSESTFCRVVSGVQLLGELCIPGWVGGLVKECELEEIDERKQGKSCHKTGEKITLSLCATLTFLQNKV
jgi:hypothetical protein